MSEETISNTSLSSSSEAEQTSEVTFDTQQFGEILGDLDRNSTPTSPVNRWWNINHQFIKHQQQDPISSKQRWWKIMVNEAAHRKGNEEAEFVQLTSSERIKLSQKDQTEVIQNITRKQHPVFKKMNLGMTDLDELVSLQTGLETAERHFAKYDLLQVFEIVTPV
jgi:hypothetical protein